MRLYFNFRSYVIRSCVKFALYIITWRKVREFSYGTIFSTFQSEQRSLCSLCAWVKCCTHVQMCDFVIILKRMSKICYGGLYTTNMEGNLKRMCRGACMLQPGKYSLLWWRSKEICHKRSYRGHKSMGEKKAWNIEQFLRWQLPLKSFVKTKNLNVK